MFRGKNYKESAKLIDKQTVYDPSEAFDLVCKASKAKFDETVELHVKLGVDGRHADQQVRGAIVLPHGTGKTRTVLVFCKPEREEEARLKAEEEAAEKAAPLSGRGLFLCRFGSACRLAAEDVFKFRLRGAGRLRRLSQAAVRALVKIIIIVIWLRQLTQFIHETHGRSSSEMLSLCIMPGAEEG